MGRVDLDPDDPETETKLQALRQKAQQLGSSVIELMYPGMPIQVFYGTNHAYQQGNETSTNR